MAGASACALMLKDYGRLLADDPDYAAKAQWVADLARDLVEVVAQEDPDRLPRPDAKLGPVAFHAYRAHRCYPAPTRPIASWPGVLS